MYVIRKNEHTKTWGWKRLRIEILLKQIRIKNGYSLRQLSKMTGISSSHLNYIEKNEKEPSLSMAVRITQALNIKIDELYRIVP